MFRERFDLIHIRLLMGACDDKEWRRLYKEAYDNLAPGGYVNFRRYCRSSNNTNHSYRWLEQMEISVDLYCDDDTMPPDSYLAGSGAVFHHCAKASGKPFDTINTMRGRIEDAGFTNIHEKNYKMPIGPWAKHPVYKDVGHIELEVWKGGMEGMYP